MKSSNKLLVTVNGTDQQLDPKHQNKLFGRLLRLIDAVEKILEEEDETRPLYWSVEFHPSKNTLMHVHVSLVRFESAAKLYRLVASECSVPVEARWANTTLAFVPSNTITVKQEAIDLVRKLLRQ